MLQRLDAAGRRAQPLHRHRLEHLKGGDGGTRTACTLARQQQRECGGCVGWGLECRLRRVSVRRPPASAGGLTSPGMTPSVSFSFSYFSSLAAGMSLGAPVAVMVKARESSSSEEGRPRCSDRSSQSCEHRGTGAHVRALGLVRPVGRTGRLGARSECGRRRGHAHPHLPLHEALRALSERRAHAARAAGGPQLLLRQVLQPCMRAEHAGACGRSRAVARERTHPPAQSQSRPA